MIIIIITVYFSVNTIISIINCHMNRDIYGTAMQILCFKCKSQRQNIHGCCVFDLSIPFFKLFSSQGVGKHLCY